MAYFKFLDKDDVPKVLEDGTVAISSLEHFRKLEEKQWGLIADRLEGASEVTVPNPFVVTEQSAEGDMLNGLFAGDGKFISLTGGAKADFSNAKFVETVPGHIYCVSYGDFATLKEYHAHEAEKKYDACLRLHDLKELAARIFETGSIIGNGKFSDLFDRFDVRAVEYDERSRQIAHGVKLIEATPFKKAIAFKSQSEARIHFVPKKGVVPADRLIVKIDDPPSLFEEVSLI